MTTDTKPVDRLGEATPFPFKVVADPNMRPGEWKLQFENERGALVMDLPAMGIPDILVPRIFKSVTSYDALTQRVKVLEEALGKIEAKAAPDCWRLKYKGSCECFCCIAREALNEGVHGGQ